LYESKKGDKVEVLPAHVTKAYRGSETIALLILNVYT
jgi:hypothetical protein